MGVLPIRTSRVRAERAIAAARVVLGISSLFAVWLDPAEPAHFVQLTYALHALYVGYSLAVAAYVWSVAPGGVLPIATHAADIVAFSVFQYLTLGPSSPFFVYFVFSLFGGALRWGWRGTLGTAAAVLPAFVVMGASMASWSAEGFSIEPFLGFEQPLQSLQHDGVVVGEGQAHGYLTLFRRETAFRRGTRRRSTRSPSRRPARTRARTGLPGRRHSAAAHHGRICRGTEIPVRRRRRPYA
jgi:hypothetical protein